MYMHEKAGTHRKRMSHQSLLFLPSTLVFRQVLIRIGPPVADDLPAKASHVAGFRHISSDIGPSQKNLLYIAITIDKHILPFGTSPYL
jgi:hypothetical protein